MIPKEMIEAFAAELRKWWSFDSGQHHTHSWHSREDFIDRELPKLLTAALSVQWREMEEIIEDCERCAQADEVMHRYNEAADWRGVASKLRKMMPLPPPPAQE